MTVTDFLLARIAEDENRELLSLANLPIGITLPDELRTRVLTDCEVKRRIVEWSQQGYAAFKRNAHDVLCLLALPYADHPDYRQEWKP